MRCSNLFRLSIKKDNMPPRRHSYRGSPLADVLLSHENVSTFENESVQTKV